MAQTNLSLEDVRALEATRQRLSQLTNTIHSLKIDVLQSNPLPEWSSIETQTGILVKNVKTMSGLLSANADLLNRTVVFPSTNYPGRTQEGLLTQLLRKKLEPGVENWVDEGRNIAAANKDDDEFLQWALQWTRTRAEAFAENEANTDYTTEELEQGIEKVNTGLKRIYDDEESGSDEDEVMGDAGIAVTGVRRTSLGQVEYGLGEVKKQPDGKSRSIEEILRFSTTGSVVDPYSSGRR